MQDYHRLIVWQKAHELAVGVQRATRAFQRSGCNTLRSQIVRAAESVPSNIVEGCFAATPKEFARFLDIAIKSTGELEYQLQLSLAYEVLPNDLHESLTTATIEVRKMLVGLRRKILARAVPVPPLHPTQS